MVVLSVSAAFRFPLLPFLFAFRRFFITPVLLHVPLSVWPF